jgi:hypothetical protein
MEFPALTNTKVSYGMIRVHPGTAPERGRSFARSAHARQKTPGFSNAFFATHALRPGTGRAPSGAVVRLPDWCGLSEILPSEIQRMRLVTNVLNLCGFPRCYFRSAPPPGEAKLFTHEPCQGCGPATSDKTGPDFYHQKVGELPLS